MTRLIESDQSNSNPPIPIASEEITFGRDPLQAIQVLDDPSVDELHARLRKEADGSFRLLDEGSTAGTWINYVPVSRDGARLEHGDLVHIGRISFRFTEREPERVRKPVILPEEPQA
jgi:pSer/pThr/pTyr-binding forkhead associated (FHA) protein